MENCHHGVPWLKCFCLLCVVLRRAAWLMSLFDCIRVCGLCWSCSWRWRCGAQVIVLIWDPSQCRIMCFKYKCTALNYVCAFRNKLTACNLVSGPCFETVEWTRHWKKNTSLHYLRIRKYNSPEHLRIHNVHSSHHRSTQEGRLEQSEVGHTAGLEVSINRALRATATAIVTHTQQCGSHRRLRCFAVRALRPIGGATLAVAARDDRRAQSTTAVVRPRAVKPGEE